MNSNGVESIIYRINKKMKVGQKRKKLIKNVSSIFLRAYNLFSPAVILLLIMTCLLHGYDFRSSLSPRLAATQG